MDKSIASELLPMVGVLKFTLDKTNEKLEREQICPKIHEKLKIGKLTHT